MDKKTWPLILAFAALSACAGVDRGVERPLTVLEVNEQRAALHGVRIVVDAYVSHQASTGVFIVSDGQPQSEGWVRCSLPVEGHALWFGNTRRVQMLRGISDTRVLFEGTFSNGVQPPPDTIFIDYVPKGSPAVASLGPLENVRVLKVYPDEQCR